MNDIAKKLIAESGNTFHCRVANAFRADGWKTLMSPYYIDESTDKAREVDLIVEKAFEVPSPNSRPRTIRMRLYIECKYIIQHVVFWFDSRNDERALSWIYRNTPFRKGNTLIKEHHHILGIDSVAKLYASESKRSEENDPIFRALNQALSGLVHNKGSELLIPATQTEAVTLVEYPVIVCSNFSTFFRTDVQGDESVESIRDNFLLEVNYAFVDRNKANRRDYFLIDVISFESLNSFFDAIEHEVDHIKILVGD